VVHETRLKAAVVLGGFVVSLLLTSTICAQTPSQRAWQILKAAAGGSNAGERAAAISVLELTPGNPDAQAMAEKALSDPKPEVRAAAAEALGGIGASSSIPALKNAVKDPEITVVVAAAKALHDLKDPAAYEVYYAILTGERKSGDSLVESQKKMLSDPKKMAQVGFAAGVGFIPFAGLGLGALKTVTKDDVSPVRAAATKILASDPDPKSADALVAASTDKSWIVRVAALDAIAHRGDPALVDRIHARLDDEKDLVRFIAAATIIRLTSSRADQ